MPTVEVLIGGNPRRVQVDGDPTPEDIEEIAAQLGGGAPPAAPSETSPGGRAVSYLKKRAEEFVGAGQSLVADVAGAVTGRDLIPGERGTLERVADVATVAAPIVAPGLTAAGTVAGAGARALGVDEPTAELIDVGTQVVAGGVGAVRGAVRGLRGGSLARAEKTLATATPEEAGEVIQAALPAAERTAREATQARTFGRAAEFAEKHGKTLAPGTPEAQRLGTRLLEAEEQWGSVMAPAERRQLTTLVDRLTDPKGAPITYQQLDQAKLALSKVRGASSIRGAIDEALERVVAGTPAAAALRAGKAAWKAELVPAKKLAQRVARADDPLTAFNRVGGSMSNAGPAERAQKLLGADSDEWQKVVGGFYGKLFESAGGDPVKAAQRWAKVREPVRRLFDPTGSADQMFRQVGKRGWGGRVGKGAVALPAAIEAGRQFYQGDYTQALATLGVGVAGTALGPGGARVAARGAAPAIGRTAVAVSEPAVEAVTAR